MQMTLSLRNEPGSAAVPEGAAAARSAGPARTADPFRKPRRVRGRVCIARRLAGLPRQGNAMPKLSRSRDVGKTEPGQQTLLFRNGYVQHRFAFGPRADCGANA